MDVDATLVADGNFGALDGLSVHPEVERYPLGHDFCVAITESAGGWSCSVQRAVGQNADGTRRWQDHEGEDGPSQALVSLLRYEVLPPVPGFDVVRLVPPPEASGERPVDDDPAAAVGLPADRRVANTRLVVVGERVAVTWARQITDGVHTAPQTLRHLGALNFLGVPDTHGMLLWTTPSGHQVPIVTATRYLPRARDGWRWSLDLLRVQAGRAADPALHELPSRVGRLVAALHLALSAPSAVFDGVTAYASADVVWGWYEQARATLQRAALVAADGTVPEAAETFLPRLPELLAAVERLAEVARGLPTGGPAIQVQRVHGDLHLGRVLRWPGGLVVSGFDDVRVSGNLDDTVKPVARELAQLLHSLELITQVAAVSPQPTPPVGSLGPIESLRGPGRHAAPGSDDAATNPTGLRLPDATANPDRVAGLLAWRLAARAQILQAYRRELALSGRAEMLDENLLVAFEAEQVGRAVLAARPAANAAP